MLPARYQLSCEGSGHGDDHWDITVSGDYVIRRRVGASGGMVIEPYAISDFSALIVKVGYRANGEVAVSVNLHSDGLGLDIPVYAAGDSRDAARYWLAWSRALALPVRMLERNGALRDPLPRDHVAAASTAFGSDADMFPVAEQSDEPAGEQGGYVSPIAS